MYIVVLQEKWIKTNWHDSNHVSLDLMQLSMMKNFRRTSKHEQEHGMIVMQYAVNALVKYPNVLITTQERINQYHY